MLTENMVETKITGYKISNLLVVENRNNKNFNAISKYFTFVFRDHSNQVKLETIKTSVRAELIEKNYSEGVNYI